ncbi:MAG TPA: tyrosine--tRNA ligase [Actinomycetota bacterium]|nr:tyrosine--tRNA ligase [Actinomycetota bacterium]
MDPRRQLELLLQDAAQVIRPEELLARLERSAREGRGLRVKLGIDPSRPDLHLGHAVVLRKLRQFQDLGHTAVLIIGDFTGRVGDPSGQTETRPFLSALEIEANARTYLEQAGLVLDLARAEVRRNSEWLASLSMEDVLRLTASATVARMLERDDFQARYREGRPISLVEFLYPLLQAMDSVAVRADVEMGGTDQTFNLLVGRDIQERYGQEPQVVFTMPLLEGTDGSLKMSKSFGNYVALTDPPDEMFGKLMRVPDPLIPKYLRLCTDLPREEVEAVARGLRDGSRHPNLEKRRLARAVVRLYHGEEAAAAAEERFDLVHRRREVPEDVPAVVVGRERVFGTGPSGERALLVPALLVELGLASSRSEARRLLSQGGVRRDGQVVAGESEPWREPEEAIVGSVWQVGRRRFARVAGLR